VPGRSVDARHGQRFSPNRATQVDLRLIQAIQIDCRSQRLARAITRA
jgi:hypothetical protein